MSSVVKYLIILGTAVFISFLFPNNTRFKYEFDKGQNWHYEDLVAPFNFAIQKPASVIEQEKATVSNTIPYYFINPDRARQRKNIFQKNFDNQVETVREQDQFTDVFRHPEKYINYGRKFIDRIYQRGLITDDHELAKLEKDKVIMLRYGNTTVKKTVESLLDTKEIDFWITDTLFQSGLPEAEFLIPLLRRDYAGNVEYDAALTDRYRNEQLTNISTTYGMVRKGELLIGKNELITDSIYQQLISYRDHYQQTIATERSAWWVYLGYLLLTLLILGVFVMYLRFHAPRVYTYFQPFCFAMMWPLIYSYLVYIVRINGSLSLYIVPFCIAPIVINIFYNERLALFTHVVVVLITSFLSDLGYAFTFLQLLAGIVAVLSNIMVRDWTRFFSSMAFIFLAYGIAYLGLSLIEEGGLSTIDWSVYTWIFLNVFLTLLAYPLIPLLERVFGFTSSITLTELSDMNKPLLKEMSIKAPGTLQHSLQVANLSEAAARKIGANAQLVKVAALYHDIGKMKHPEFFIENQKGQNPHDDLKPIESAEKIIEHIPYGVELAQEHHLPEILIDFIRTHHGTTRVEYFYHQHVEKNPKGIIDQKAFRYPGPRPRTKEEAILLLADSIEAATKGIKDPCESDIDNMVNKIVQGKIMKGQLIRSQLSFRELEVCKLEFKKLLNSIYHVRVEYPE